MFSGSAQSLTASTSRPSPATASGPSLTVTVSASSEPASSSSTPPPSVNNGLTPEQTAAVNKVGGGPHGAGGGPGALSYFNQFNDFLSNYAATQTIITATPWASDADARFVSDIQSGALRFISTQTAITGLAQESMINDAMKDLGIKVSSAAGPRRSLGTGVVAMGIGLVAFAGAVAVL